MKKYLSEKIYRLWQSFKEKTTQALVEMDNYMSRQYYIQNRKENERLKKKDSEPKA